MKRNIIESKKIHSKLTITKPLIVGLFFLLVALFLFTSISHAQEASIEEQYAPIFYFENDEHCYPVAVDYHIDNSILYQFTGDTPVELSTDVSMQDLSDYSTESDATLYLDNNLGTPQNDAIINDYASKKNTLGYTVYTNTIYPAQDVTIIQYWLFYAFNKGDLNQHEGDWELIQIVLKPGSSTELMYSQHHSGQRATWQQIDKTGNHPHVYVARGSHANYFKSYSGTLGIASDHVGSNGFILEPDDYTLIDLETQNWLPFRGRWGETNSQEDIYLGKSGSPGPMYREDGAMWNQPLNWGASLPVLNPTILFFEWIIYHFITIFIVLLVLSLVLFIYRRIKQYKTEGFGPRIFSFLYIDGLNPKSIGNILFIIGIIIAFTSLFSPWYSVTASSTSSFYATDGLIDIITIDGLQGISLTMPDTMGPTPLGSAMIPFSVFIVIGLILTLIKTLGVKESSKLGRSYLYQGIKLILPVIAIIGSIVVISMIAQDMIPLQSEETAITTLFQDISSSPFGGSSQTTLDSDEGSLYVIWGIQSGGLLLLLSGIIITIGGYLERKAKTTLY